MDLTASSAVNLHGQRQLFVGCRLNWNPVNSQDVFGRTGAATVHFHKKLGVFHVFSSPDVWKQTNQLEWD